MPRHSFIQMSKLPNVKGRISYITSHARQENLYATYRTADSTFWSNLARESQQEFQRSGAEGKCIEARELIIALPEIYTQYEPQQVLTDFTEEFRRRYGVECVSALHHNMTRLESVSAPKRKSRGRTGRYGKAVPSSKKARYTKAICLLPKIHALRESLFSER